MGKRASTVQEWFSLNREELIHCPYQLGNLKITKSACLQQRRRSDDWVYGTVPDNYVLFGLEMHLKVCRQCAIESTVPAAAAGPDPDPLVRRFRKMGRSANRNVRLPGSAPPAAGGAVQPGKERLYGDDQHYRKQNQADL